jgi:hypothetical protein
VLTRNADPAPYEGAPGDLYRNSWRKRCHKESNLIGGTVRDEVSPELIRLANIPAARADLFRYEVGHCLTAWHLKLAFHSKGDTEAGKDALRHDANALLATFRKLDKHPILAIYLTGLLTDPASHPFRQVLSGLSDLVAAVDQAQSSEYRHGRGALLE